ncbi:hypothetical protein AeRB84_019195 [Aphanomyces euteiches]|nr:hypothetical protein AeRB84_019195 [Aphanomyces euteiches]
METLGYSLDAMLVRARGHKSEWDLDPAAFGSVIVHAQVITEQLPADAPQNIEFCTPLPLSIAAVVSVPRHVLSPPKLHDSLDEMISAIDNVDIDDITSTTKLATPVAVDVLDLLNKRIDDAAENRLSPAGIATLRDLLSRHADVFRLNFGCDPRVKVPALSVRVRPGVSPAKYSSKLVSCTKTLPAAGLRPRALYPSPMGHIV